MTTTPGHYRTTVACPRCEVGLDVTVVGRSNGISTATVMHCPECRDQFAVHMRLEPVRGKWKPPRAET